jgi:hypothetical protein
MDQEIHDLVLSGPKPRKPPLVKETFARQQAVQGQMIERDAMTAVFRGFYSSHALMRYYISF